MVASFYETTYLFKSEQKKILQKTHPEIQCTGSDSWTLHFHRVHSSFVLCIVPEIKRLHSPLLSGLFVRSREKN